MIDIYLAVEYQYRIYVETLQWMPHRTNYLNFLGFWGENLAKYRVGTLIQEDQMVPRTSTEPTAVLYA